MADYYNLMLALQQLLAHKAGKKAFLDLQTAKMQLSPSDLKALADNPDFTEVQKQAAIIFAKTIHRNEINMDSELQVLLHDFQKAENKDAKFVAWQTFADVALKACHMVIDNPIMFITEPDCLVPLSIFVISYVNEFNGKLQHDKTFALKISKLLFCVAYFNGMAYLSEACDEWCNKAEQFILINNLENAEEHAILLNFRGSEILKRFIPYNLDGTLNKFPDECISYFQRALDLHTKIGSTLDVTPHMRHVQVCFAVAKARNLQYQFQNTTQHTLGFKQSFKECTNQIFNLLQTLYPALGLDGYSIAECLQVEAILYLLQGELSKAVEAATTAISYMSKKQDAQGFNILNEAGNIYVAMAYVLYRAVGNSESKFMIKQMAGHPYIKLIQQISSDSAFQIAPTKDLLSVADDFVIMATACYFKSYHISKCIFKLGHPYADQPKIALQRLGIKDELLNFGYFDPPIEQLLEDIVGADKVPYVGPNIDLGENITTMFTMKLQEGLNRFKGLLMSMVYNPFSSGLPQKPK